MTLKTKNNQKKNRRKNKIKCWKFLKDYKFQISVVINLIHNKKVKKMIKKT